MYGYVAVVGKRVCAYLLRGIHVDVPAARSFIFEGGSNFLHVDRLLDPEDGGRTRIRNVGNHLLVNMAQHYGRM